MSMGTGMRDLLHLDAAVGVGHRSGTGRRSGADRRGRSDRRRVPDLFRELGRPGLLDLRDGAERRSGRDRRSGPGRRRAGAGIVTPWQLPDGM